MLRAYANLTKPRMVAGNLVTTLAGFLFASRISGEAGWHIRAVLLLATLVGLALVIAGGCVLNNVIDYDIDTRMARTKERALARGAVSRVRAGTFGGVLSIAGLFVLYMEVNELTALAASVGLVFYVICYSIAKRRSSWGAVVGSVSGAVPIVAGYTAAAGRFDRAACILFAVLVVWQMPHFYAIAIRRMDEYRAAGIPVLPLKRGTRVTIVRMVLYILAFIVATVSLYVYGFAGVAYLCLVSVVGFVWLAHTLKGFGAFDTVRWARASFLLSLCVLLVFCAAIATTPLLL
jgi:protoheme IX farnesyltransferase